MAEGPSVLGGIIDLWPRLQVNEHLPTSEYDKGLVLLRLALIWCIRCVFELYIHTTVVTLQTKQRWRNSEVAGFLVVAIYT